MENKYEGRTDILVALDIGTTKVIAIAGRLDEFDRLEILGVGKVKSEGVLRGVVSNIDRTTKAIKEAITQAERNSKAEIKVVHVGIAGQHIASHHRRNILTRDSAKTEISDADIEKLIEGMHKMALPAGDKILHVIPQDFTVDNEKGILDPIGMSGIRLEANFHVITGQITAANNILRCAEKAGLKVADLTLEPIASASAVLSKEEKEAGVVLVDMGGGTTDISIFHEGIIRHTSVVPFGGNAITKDIKEGCRVMDDRAEKLKTRFGSAFAEEIYDNRIITIPGIQGRDPKEISEKNLARIIQARVEEIFDFVMWEIKRSGYERKLIAGIVLTGGGSQLKHIDILAEYQTGLNTRIGMPSEEIMHSYDDRVASPTFATSVGLLLNAVHNRKATAEDVMEEEEVENSEEKSNSGRRWTDKIRVAVSEFFEASEDKDF